MGSDLEIFQKIYQDLQLDESNLKFSIVSRPKKFQLGRLIPVATVFGSRSDIFECNKKFSDLDAELDSSIVSFSSDDCRLASLVSRPTKTSREAKLNIATTCTKACFWMLICFDFFKTQNSYKTNFSVFKNSYFVLKLCICAAKLKNQMLQAPLKK